MAEYDFTTYSGLKTAVAGWLNRRDLTDQVPGFIRLGHAVLNRRLRVIDMQEIAEATTDEGRVAVPGDFLAPHSLELDGMTEPLEFVTEEVMKEKRRLRTTASQSRWYTIWGRYFELYPEPTEDVDFTLKYYANIPTLSASITTNWLLQRHPDLYLYASLCESAPFLKNDERLLVWKSEREDRIGQLNLASERARYPQGKLVATRRGF
jgi:hypothetical protein